MMLEALFFLFIKHFICDFPLQAFSWVYRYKGIYLHPGGLTHAAIHGLGTYLVLVFFLGPSAWLYAGLDFVVHYHIDWAKMKINDHYGLTATKGEWFWILLGFDQLLHHITYFAIIFYAFE